MQFTLLFLADGRVRKIPQGYICVDFPLTSAKARRAAGRKFTVSGRLSLAVCVTRGTRGGGGTVRTLGDG